MRARRDRIGSRTVRSLVVAPPEKALAHVVIVPGLGALGYLLPTISAVAARRARCTLLDLPGFGSDAPLSVEPTVPGIAEGVAQWILEAADGLPLVLAGHSTGAQAALRAALLLQHRCHVSRLVLAGPTVAPSQRSLVRLAATAPRAYRRDSPRELVSMPDYLRAGRHLLTMLRDCVADRPEQAIASLRVPLVLTAGRQDAFAPLHWLRTLATAAVAAPAVTTVQLPGSHNNPYTFPERVAQLLLTDATPPAVGT